MKAEDTVMSKEQTNEIFCPVPRVVMPKHRAKVTLTLPEQLPYLEAQAEITWDKCREQTAREIFEELSSALLWDGTIVGFQKEVWQSLKSKYLPKEEK